MLRHCFDGSRGPLRTGQPAEFFVKRKAYSRSLANVVIMAILLGCWPVLLLPAILNQKRSYVSGSWRAVDRMAGVLGHWRRLLMPRLALLDHGALDHCPARLVLSVPHRWQTYNAWSVTSDKRPSIHYKRTKPTELSLMQFYHFGKILQFTEII